MRPPSTSIKWCINTGIPHCPSQDINTNILVPAYFIFQICDIFSVLRMTATDMIHMEAPQALIYSQSLKVAFNKM